MQGRDKLCAKLSSAFLRKWWFVLATAVILLLAGIICAIFFGSWVRLFIDHELVLRPGSMTFEWWARPPVRPFVKVYVYNVTNADEFLNNGSKPILDELGPYVYSEEWEKVNITDNENGTLSFHYKRTYTFQPELSSGPDDDAVVVPNIPMLSATSQSKHAARFLRLAMASIMDILKIKPFVEVSVGQLLWGYEDPLLKLAKDVVPKEQKLPYEEFGLFYGKNATSPDVATLFTGATDMSKYGIFERYNMRDKLPHWTTDECNSIAGSDGSIFPPHITRNDTLAVYDKDLCRLLPLKYLRDTESAAGVQGFRFTPPEDVFAENEHNKCFCPAGPPCAPNGLFNVSLCQYDSPIMLSFPHFYLADESLREAVEGISPPEPEKHRLFIDIQPEMGIAMRARARIQINLAVSQVVDIKQVANFPDIVFPILWFEEGIDELPDQVTSLLRLATKVPPIAQLALGWGLSALGVLLILLAVTCLIRYLRDTESAAGVQGFRFTPPEDVFAENEHNKCFCPAGPPCAPNGLFNVSLCQYDSPIMLSFPHFYLADESLREAVEGISPPEPEKHRLFIDIQPEMGIAMRARARIQINLAVSQVVDIKQVANFPDIVFPILWFEEGIDELPDQVTSLLRLATKVPPIARLALGWGLSALGVLLILLAVTCLIRYLRDTESAAGVQGFRFTPPEDVFAENEHNKCFCPAGPPCAPNGLFNVSLCQYDSPIMLSFPHFYLADESLREAVEGISPPEPEKHRLFIDIQPEMGIAMRARARIQINLAVSQVVDIKQVANFPDIVFPILWFEEGIDELPDQVTSLLRLANKVPPIARLALGWGLSALGVLLILLAVTCLIRSSHRQSTLRLEGHVVAKPPPPKTPSKENGYELNSRR